MKYSGPTLNDTAPLGRTCTLGITSNVQPPASFVEYEADASKLTGRRRSLNTSADAFQVAGVAASGPPPGNRAARAPGGDRTIRVCSHKMGKTPHTKPARAANECDGAQGDT